MKKEIDIPESPEPPKCCPKCGCKEYKQTNLDWIESTLCEYTVKCCNCDEALAHWAYGHWQY